MARKSVEVRRCIDNCVKVVAHSQAKTLAAKAEDGAWLMWGEVPVAHAAEAEDDLEVDSYSLPRPVELKVRESDVQRIAINDAGVMYTNDNGELFQTLIDFEEVGPHQVVIAASQAVPISLPVNNPIQQFCCGDDFTLLLTRSGQVFSFGEGTHGQLGHGDLLVREQPTLVESLRRLTIGSIAVGSHHCLAYCDNDDCIYTWGAGSRGQLGHGRAENSYTPRKVELEGADTSYVTLCCGRETSGAVTADGKAFVWGSNSHRQLGFSTTKEVFVPTRAELHATARDIAQLVLGDGIGIACTRDQRLFGWGSKLPWTHNEGEAPTLIMTQDEFARQTDNSSVTSIALLGRQVYCHTADKRVVKCFPSVPNDSVTSTDPSLLKLAVLVFGHVHTFDRLAMARAWQKWRHQLPRGRADATTQLKACAVRMLVSMLKTSQNHRLRKCWSRWRDEAQEQRVTARMEAITSEYQTSLHQMRRTKSDLQDAMQQYRADVRSKELKLSKTIGAKRVAAILKSQVTRRVRSAFERWKLISSYATEATQMRNEKYKLEIGMYQLTTQQKEFQGIEAQTRRMQITLAAVTAFYRWKLGAERWKMQLMQEEFQAERATVMKELHGLLAQIEKVNTFEREAVAAARARGASLVHELFVARKLLQDTKESPTKPPRQGSNGAAR